MTSHSKVLRKSSDDTRHCSANEMDTVDLMQNRRNKSEVKVN